jgi:hypothetical protein
MIRTSRPTRRALQSRVVRLLLVAIGAAGANPAGAFSSGSPLCEVLEPLPLVAMSPTLAQPPPEGWRLRVDARFYYPGRPVRVQVVHPDPSRRARGVLLWARSGPTTGAGRFQLPASGYQYIPASSNCGEWALSHDSGEGKPQAAMRFFWEPDAAPSAILRAFLVEDCGLPPGGCMDQQALTPIVALERGLFRDGFGD